MLLLEPIERGTCFLSGSSYPTHGDVRFVFLDIQEHLTQYINDEDFFQREMADSIYQKLDEYWPIMDSDSCISAVLDPRTKLSVFLTDTEKNKVKDSINNLAKYYSTTTSTAPSTTGSELVDTRNYFRKLCNINTDLNNSALQSNSSNNLAGDLEKYLLHDLEDNIEPLLWWKTQTKEYPILSQIACDFLSIQATSVASEQAFSVAGHTLTAERNRLHADTARATLCVKSWIHNDIC